MSVQYRAVSWTRHKRIYDLVLAGGVLAYLGIFVAVGLGLDANATLETQAIRALGTCAFVLLHVILSIGPLARLDRRFLPLLYNRRHLGVTMFLLGLAHGGFAIFQFHGQGDVNPLVSVLTSDGRYDRLGQFPFQPLGLAALVVLFLMAATSHDFWLANLTAPVWKTLHMLVYVVYALLVVHVALGVLQAERHPALAVLVGLGVVWVCGLHLVAGVRERPADRECRAEPDDEGFVFACRLGDIQEDRARIVTLSGERVAVFKYDGKVSAISNVCQHQNGPLGEGKIIDGCVTCPWHGYQYRPEDGASPPPFRERVPTFRVKLRGDLVLVHPRPNPPGTRVEPARIADTVA
jgi:nitrite reductase/ring-hydroxylating ferredoxin subunit/DMSO/TMAO reductase YedYZ heme-binding membrane subunit